MTIVTIVTIAREGTVAGCSARPKPSSATRFSSAIQLTAIVDETHYSLTHATSVQAAHLEVRAVPPDLSSEPWRPAEFTQDETRDTVHRRVIQLPSDEGADHAQTGRALYLKAPKPDRQHVGDIVGA
jgi:hypothetical protein